MISNKEKLAYVFKYASKSDEKLQKIIRLAATMDSAKSKLNEEQKQKVKQALSQAYDKIKSINDKAAPAKTKSSKSTGKKQSTKSSDIKSALSELKQKVGKIEYKRAITGTNIARDLNVPALPSGKRTVRKKGYTTNQYGRHANKVGSTYYESRANRMDVNQPSKSRNPKLAKGGQVESLEKELRKLQRDLNSSRLSTYREGDNSAEEKARQKEREVKLARFDEVLKLLRASESKQYAEGGEVEKVFMETEGFEYAKGGRTYTNWTGRKRKEKWGKMNLYEMYDNSLDLMADLVDYLSQYSKEMGEFDGKQIKKEMAEVITTNTLKYNDGSTLRFAEGGMTDDMQIAALEKKKSLKGNPTFNF